MSGKVVGWALDQRLGSSTAKLVPVKLADNANDQGFCWPGVASLAADTELTDRSIREPLTLVLATPRQVQLGQEKFGDRLRRAFDDDLVFDFERARAAADA